MSETPEKLMTPAEVSEWLGVPIKTLASWRLQGKGPRSLRLGKHRRHDPADVRQWLEQEKADA